MRTPAILIAALAGLVFTAAGCGGDSSATQTTAARARTLEQVEQICDTWSAAVHGRTFPVNGFDPGNPDPADLPAVGDYFDVAVRAQGKALVSLRSLAPAPEAVVDVDRYTAALAALHGLVTEQVAAARAADPERFTATLDDADARIEAVNRAADDLGIDSCQG